MPEQNEPLIIADDFQLAVPVIDWEAWGLPVPSDDPVEDPASPSSD